MNGPNFGAGGKIQAAFSLPLNLEPVVSVFPQCFAPTLTTLLRGGHAFAPRLDSRPNVEEVLGHSLVISDT